MIDMHCHILPDLDDGSTSMEESIKIVREAKASGFTGSFATPHYLGEQSANRIETKNRVKILREEIHNQNIDFKIYEGNEIYMFEDVFKIIDNKEACTLNDTKYVLVEIPRKNKVFDIENLFFKLCANGYLPILAHPERYDFVQKDPNILIKYVDMGIYLQLNFTSLLGYYGKEAERTAKILLNHDYISFIGSDAHRSGVVHNEMDNVFQIIKKYTSKETFEKIINNPQFVVEGKKIEKNHPFPYIKKMFDFIKY